MKKYQIKLELIALGFHSLKIILYVYYGPIGYSIDNLNVYYTVNEVIYMVTRKPSTLRNLERTAIKLGMLVICYCVKVHILCASSL
jgi:hypothetical protein